jgi:hypothetical protein
MLRFFFMSQIYLFNKWSYRDLEVKDVSLFPYLCGQEKTQHLSLILLGDII